MRRTAAGFPRVDDQAGGQPISQAGRQQIAEQAKLKGQAPGPYYDGVARDVRYRANEKLIHAQRSIPEAEAREVLQRRAQLKAFRASGASPGMTKPLIEHLARTPPGLEPFEPGTNGQAQAATQRFLASKGLLTKSDGSWGPDSGLAWRQWVDQANNAQPIRYERTEEKFTTLDAVSFKVGHKGPEVRKAIEKLAELGFYKAKVNSYWGLAAEDALAAYRALKRIEESCSRRKERDE